MLARPAARAALRPAAAHARPLAIITAGPKAASYKEKNEALGRPMSPHVTIYAFPLAAIASITHRITGFGLVVGVYGMALNTLLGGDTALLMESIGNSSIGGLAKLCVAFPVIYHTAGGVRHLYWEQYPDGLNPTSQYQTSAALLGVSGLAALGFALV